jgi:MFS family permease
MSMQMYGDYGAIQLAISFALAFPFGWLADKIHPLRLTMISLFLYAMTSLLAFFFVRTPATFAAAHVICGACAGMWLTATAPLGPAILPKLKFMQYLSAMHIVAALGRIIISYACGRFLDRVHHDYHYIYIWACVLITMSLIASFVVYRKFMALGGPRSYVPPE